MLVLDDDRLRTRIMQLRDHGRVQGDTMFFNEEVGWKYKMSSMQAALGLAQLERLDELVAKNRQIFSWYRQELADWNLGRLNPDVPGLFNSYWMTTVLLDGALGIKKEALIPLLRRQGVDVRPFFYPLSAIPAFHATPEAELARTRNKVSYSVSPFALNLPSALALDRAAVVKTCNVLRTNISALKPK